jgi:hypothetical protein
MLPRWFNADDCRSAGLFQMICEDEAQSPRGDSHTVIERATDPELKAALLLKPCGAFLQHTRQVNPIDAMDDGTQPIGPM